MLPYKDHFGADDETMQRTLALALSRGGNYSDLFFEHTILNQITMEEGIVKQGEKVIAHGVGVRVVKGEGTGYAYTEEITLEKMKEAARTASAIANAKAEIGPVSLTNVQFANRYPIEEPTTGAPLAKKITWIEEAERAAREYDPRVIKVSVSLADDLSTVQIATSGGAILRDTRPMMRFIVTVVAESNGNRQVGTSSGGGRIGNEYFALRMSPAEHGREAARQAILLLGAIDAPAGPMELILAHAESGVLLHETVGHPLEADFIRKGTSAYTNRVGHKVASELVTVIDNGTIPNDRGSINFDDEGTVSSSTTLIENGILRGYMHDRISAGLFGVPPTGNGRRESYKYPPAPRMTVTYLANGSSDPEEILRSTRRGIYCKSFRGGEVDISNGDFVFVPIEAYLVEDGGVKAPVKNLTIIGNGPDVLSKVTMVGSDLAISDGRWTCGKGQHVPVGVGLPTVKISEITVGGSEIGA
ncbi:MAG TPA: metallopeptidase TldD-related protein [Candidatus Bathyarchaeia archaeon]|nr:metallopeptidase TldD-related protein [Candidatus Bathyarchaeia archaeon]